VSDRKHSLKAASREETERAGVKNGFCSGKTEPLVEHVPHSKNGEEKTRGGKWDKHLILQEGATTTKTKDGYTMNSWKGKEKGREKENVLRYHERDSVGKYGMCALHASSAQAEAKNKKVVGIKLGGVEPLNAQKKNSRCR